MVARTKQYDIATYFDIWVMSCIQLGLLFNLPFIIMKKMIKSNQLLKEHPSAF